MSGGAPDTALDRRAFLTSAATVLAAPLILSASARAMDRPPAPEPHTFPPAAERALRYAAARRGIRFGSAIRSDTLRYHPAMSGFFLAECSSLTPEWQMKWESLAYSGPHYDFSDCDLIVNFARQHGLAIRGHALLWHLSAPRWAQQQIIETRDWSIVEHHIRTVVGRYADAVDQWDVVNEPIDASGPGGLRENLFLSAYGRDYIEQSIRITHEMAPHARTFINDYSLEYGFEEEQQRRRAFIALLEHLLVRGVPLSGVGVQAHLDLRKGALAVAEIRSFFDAIESMGLEIAITEMDVREADILLPINQRDMLVSDEVRRYLDAVLPHGQVSSISTWGLSDSLSWLVETTHGHPWNRGLLYDQDWRAKPMRTALAELMA